jgi:hypothetical protein
MRTTTKLMATAALLALLAGCGSSRPDAAITTDIQSKLFSAPDVKTASVDVATSGGVVTLSGTVPNDAARYEAYKIANETQGVTKVTDQMTVAQAQTQAEPEPAPAMAVRPLAPAPKTAHSPAKPQQAQRRETAAADVPPVARDLAPSPAPAPEPLPVAAAAPPAPAPPTFVQPAPPPPPVMRTTAIPSGTILRVQTVDSVDSAVNKAGEVFRASLAAPVVINSDVVVPAGTDLYLRLVDASSAGRIKGRSGLTLELASMEFQGQTYQLSSTDYQQTGASEGKRTAATIGVGTAVGAALGGIFGGGKGAAIGAGAGAGAGTIGSAATKGQQVKIAAETKLDFTLQQPVSVTYNPDKNRSSR